MADQLKLTVHPNETMPRPVPVVSPTLRNVIVLFYTVAVPVLLTLLSVRLVMTPLFLKFEYYRADFPEDIYGFTTEDRMTYAPLALNYLLNGADISYLADQTFPSGRPLYTDGELRHMEDVKVVTRAAYFLLFFLGILTGLLTALLVRSSSLRPVLYDGLFRGALLTLFLIGAIVMLSVVAWDMFFTGFHQLFFETGTWRFAYSDTLIRLFPERFWFDAALTIGIVTTGGALTILIASRRWGTQNKANSLESVSH